MKPVIFTSAEARDALAKRLLGMAEAMLRARDQGSDHRFYPTDDDMGDIQAAAACVLGCEIEGKVNDLLEWPVNAFDH